MIDIIAIAIDPALLSNGINQSIINRVLYLNTVLLVPDATDILAVQYCKPCGCTEGKLGTRSK